MKDPRRCERCECIVEEGLRRRRCPRCGHLLCAFCYKGQCPGHSRGWLAGKLNALYKAKKQAE